MSRRRLSSASFSDMMVTRKSSTNSYNLASAVPSCGGFDQGEAKKYKKGLFRFKKKDKGFARRNTLSSCSVLTEFLEERGSVMKGGAIRSVDDVDVMNTLAFTLPRQSSVCSFRRQDSMGDAETKQGYVKNSVSLRNRYAFSKMSEGRKAQVVLLDDATLEILVQPKLFAVELLDLVASRFGLKEREYFGLAFKDDTNHFQWLQLDRKVLEHEFIKKSGPLVLYFAIRFFIESISFLRDSATVELFYCLAKQAVYKEQIECSSEVVFELAALALQETYGDYTENETTKKHLLKLPVLPTGVLKEHPSLAFCEDQVIERYRKMIGKSRGDVIVQYMAIVETLPTYGIHYYEVKDKSGIPWWLGLSYKGISLYDNNDKKMPRRVFAWSHLENLYYREKKFSIEVHDPKRVIHTLSSFNLYEDAILEPLENFDDLSDAISDPTTQVSVSRRTFGPSNVNVHAWFAATPQLTKSIWSMAVSQHQFYLDRKQTRSQSQVGRSMTDIAAELCVSPCIFSTSTTPTLDGPRTGSQCFSSTAMLSTSSASVESSGADSETHRAAQRELYTALKARKESIEEKLRSQLEKLKQVCLQEAELTGELPIEYPVEPGEAPPVVRKRIGTTFPLSPKVINRDCEGKDELGQLEIELELQSKIVKAAEKLIQENSDKNIRKTRQQAYHKELEKLRAIEQRLVQSQKEAEQRAYHHREEQRFFPAVASPGYKHQHFYNCINATSMPQLYRQKIPPAAEFKKAFKSTDVACVQAAESSDRQLRRSKSSVGGSPSTQSLQPKSAPSSPVRQFYKRQHSVAALASPTPTRHQRAVPANSAFLLPEYLCSHAHQGSSAVQRITRQLGSTLPLHSAPCGHERDKNVYNLRTRQSDCYESGDELSASPYGDYQSRLHWMFANNRLCSLHKTYQQQFQDGSRCASHLNQDGLDSGGSPRMVHDHGSYKVTGPFFSYENGVYGSPQQHGHLFDYGARYGASISSQHPLPSKSSSKDSAIHLGCSLSSLSSHPAVVPHLCEPVLMPPAQCHMSRFHTSPFLSSSDSTQLYDGVNLSHEEGTPSPEPFSGNLKAKNPAFREVSKPFEMSDFYKYSERLRRQRQHEEGSQSPLCSSSSGSLPHISRSVGAINASSVGSSDRAASDNGLILGSCHSAEPNCAYHGQLKDLVHSPGIHLVESDSCIDYPSYDGSYVHPSESGPRHSSPFFALQITESDAYHPADRNRTNPDPTEISFGSFNAGNGVAEAFEEEMFAWYEKNERLSQSPDGPSTLV